MPTTITFPITPATGTWSLAGTLRRILDAGGNAVRIETAPQSPFAGDPEFDSADLSAWSVANAGSLAVADSDTTAKNNLYLAANATNAQMEAGNANAGRYYQSLTGDFDVYCRCGHQYGGVTGVWLSAFATDGSENWAAVSLYNADSINGEPEVIFRAVAGGSATTANTGPAPDARTGISLWLRLNRAGDVFSAYYTWDGGASWAQQGTNQTVSMTAGANVGVSLTTYSTVATARGWIDFLRSWPPYDTGSPSASVVVDSGAAGATWTPSTFTALTNQYAEYDPQSQIGFGTLKYQIGAADTNPPTLNGSWLTQTGVRGLGTLTGRYLKLAVQFNSPTGAERATFCGAYLDATLPSGGGILDQADWSGGLL